MPLPNDFSSSSSLPINGNEYEMYSHANNNNTLADSPADRPKLLSPETTPTDPTSSSKAFGSVKQTGKSPKNSQAQDQQQQQQQQQQQKQHNRTKSRDPNRPKRPLSAYNLFFQHQRQVMLQQLPVRAAGKPRHSHGKIGFQEMAKSIGQQWKSIDKTTKAHFEALAAVHKERHAQALQAYKQTVGQKETTRPKKQQTAVVPTPSRMAQVTTDHRHVHHVGATAPRNVFSSSRDIHHRNNTIHPLPVQERIETKPARHQEQHQPVPSFHDIQDDDLQEDALLLEDLEPLEFDPLSSTRIVSNISSSTLSTSSASSQASNMPIMSYCHGYKGNQDNNGFNRAWDRSSSSNVSIQPTMMLHPTTQRDDLGLSRNDMPLVYPAARYNNDNSMPYNKPCPSLHYHNNTSNDATTISSCSSFLRPIPPLPYPVARRVSTSNNNDVLLSAPNGPLSSTLKSNGSYNRHQFQRSADGSSSNNNNNGTGMTTAAAAAAAAIEPIPFTFDEW